MGLFSAMQCVWMYVVQSHRIPYTGATNCFTRSSARCHLNTQTPSPCTIMHHKTLALFLLVKKIRDPVGPLDLHKTWQMLNQQKCTMGRERDKENLVPLPNPPFSKQPMKTTMTGHHNLNDHATLHTSLSYATPSDCNKSLKDSYLFMKKGGVDGSKMRAFCPLYLLKPVLETAIMPHAKLKLFLPRPRAFKGYAYRTNSG